MPRQSQIEKVGFNPKWLQTMSRLVTSHGPMSILHQAKRLVSRAKPFVNLSR